MPGMSNEAIINKPLNGLEVIELIVQDVRQRLKKETLLSEYAAYGRLAYTVDILLDLDNPLQPRHLIPVRSRNQRVEGEPPLKNRSEQAQAVALSRTRKITSPNMNRIAAGLPIQVVTHQEGKVVTRELHYDPEDAPPPEAPEDFENSEKVEKEWGGAA